MQLISLQFSLDYVFFTRNSKHLKILHAHNPSKLTFSYLIDWSHKLHLFAHVSRERNNANKEVINKNNTY